MFHVRLAAPADLPVLRELIPASVRALSQGHYSAAQIESAIRYVFGPDTQLVADGTYFVVQAESELVGCGGWSCRRTLYGGDQMKADEDPRLDPATEAARIRAFFVHPGWARRGIGSAILEACICAAREALAQRIGAHAARGAGGGRGAPEAWLLFEPESANGLQDLKVGEEVLVLTWLDRAGRWNAAR